MAHLWLVFTDLDGTLLDEETYSFEAALPAVRILRMRKIPVIPCTSKTHVEVIFLRRQLHLDDPFIVENGSAIFIPEGYFPRSVSDVHIEGYEVIVLGKSHSQILRCFAEMRQNFSLEMRGFSEMSVQEIREHTGLAEAQARMAQKRYFSEPFVCRDELSGNRALAEFLSQRGCRLLRGNRFYHLLGDSDKGRAAKTLSRLFETETKRTYRTLGLGDSKNDIDLLTAVDQPVLIRKKDGRYSVDFASKKLFKTRQPGPAGWREAIEHFINKNGGPNG